MSLKADEDKKVIFDKDNPHWHCTKCFGKDYYIVNGDLFCKKCVSDAIMIFCTPMICGSS